jgi:threonine dehydratase/serine racemase
MTYAANLASIRDAAARLDGVAHRTPVVTSRTLDELAGRSIFLKCENQQRVGAFKFRGAWNAIRRLSDEDAARGVVTHTSGNHAQAVALAARLRGIRAEIVMPSNAPGVKKRAVLGYGAHVVECEPTLESRESTSAEIAARTGAVMIPPFDHPDVIAGQGTVALELLEQAPDLDAIVAPVGGGGLISGIALAVREAGPRVRVFAGEPSGADDAARSRETGERVRTHVPKTIADGLLTCLGDLTWPVVRDCVEGVVRVTDEEIVTAMRFLWERTKLVVEPSGAVPLAAVLSGSFPPATDVARVGVVLTGGNVDLDRLPWVSRG